MNRRVFLKTILGTVIVTGIKACNPPHYNVINSPFNATLAHRLQQPILVQKNLLPICIDTIIVGAGVSGLAAAKHLQASNKDFLVIEQDTVIGGNAKATLNSNTYSGLGAHYLPITNANMVELNTWLEQINVITGWENNKPIFNENYLCFDPHERLFINNRWQDTLIPLYGVPKNDAKQISIFFETTTIWQQQKLGDGSYKYTIPFNTLTALQNQPLVNISAKDWLLQNGFTSTYLLEHINYSLSDDYGSNLENTSALGLMQYFGSRRGSAANALSNDVLTWPEGNFFLIQQLAKDFIQKIKLQHLVENIDVKNNTYTIQVFNNITKQTINYTCNNIIVATPHQVNKKICFTTISNVLQTLPTLFKAPWVVANITLSALPPESNGAPLAWDNVIYGTGSLGFIYNNHNQLQVVPQQPIFTYYKVYNIQHNTMARQWLHNTSIENIAKQIIIELEQAYPTFKKYISQVQIHQWGHGMVAPTVGLHTPHFINWQKKLPPNMYFVHTDYIGFSIFEEAFYSGLTAAKKITHATLDI